MPTMYDELYSFLLIISSKKNKSKIKVVDEFLGITMLNFL